MFFTDVRLKTYIEIRPADAMPIPYVIALRGADQGLFYAPTSLDAMDGCSPTCGATTTWRRRTRSWRAATKPRCSDGPSPSCADRIVKIARDGLADEEQGSWSRSPTSSRAA